MQIRNPPCELPDKIKQNNASSITRSIGTRGEGRWRRHFTADHKSRPKVLVLQTYSYAFAQAGQDFFASRRVVRVYTVNPQSTVNTKGKSTLYHWHAVQPPKGMPHNFFPRSSDYSRPTVHFSSKFLPTFLSCKWTLCSSVVHPPMPRADAEEKRP